MPNKKITYLLGAGASYYSNPIWKAQGESMLNVAESIFDRFKPSHEYSFKTLKGHEKLIDFINKLKIFAKHAIDYGSIDIYAKRLSLLGAHKELNDLKFCLSVYFDIWENFYYKNYCYKYDDLNPHKNYYEKIDKRYFSLLSVLLEADSISLPKLNENVSFLTWNYDLQLETAIETFFPNELGVEYIHDKNKIIHLNGFRSCFDYNGNRLITVEKDNLLDTESYLKGLNQILDGNKINFSNTIKYAWELDSETKEKAIKIMKETDILVIIGYSFPAFNRKIDSELLNLFQENNHGDRKIYYQDPFGNFELVKSLIIDDEIEVKHIENSSQFHIPNEFLI